MVAVDEEPDRDDDLERIADGLMRFTGGALGGIAGYVIDPALGPLIAGPAGPELATITDAVASLRRSRAAATLATAAAELDIEPDEITERILADPALAAARIQITATALEGAARSIADEKLRLFGRLIADGLLADTGTELALDHQLTRALVDLEAPHFRILHYLHSRGTRTDADGTPVTGDRLRRGRTTDDIKGRTRRAQAQDLGIPGYATGADGLLAVLAGHGMVIERPPDWSRAVNEAAQGNLHAGREHSTWWLTDLGRELLDRAERAGGLQPSDWSPDES